MDPLLKRCCDDARRQGYAVDDARVESAAQAFCKALIDIGNATLTLNAAVTGSDMPEVIQAPNAPDDLVSVLRIIKQVAERQQKASATGGAATEADVLLEFPHS